MAENSEELESRLMLVIEALKGLSAEEQQQIIDAVMTFYILD